MIATRLPLHDARPSSLASRPAPNCSNIREVARSQTPPGPSYKARSKTTDYSITYAYDSLGRRDRMIDPDGGRTTYAYDPAGRMSWLKNWLNERTTWAYDNLGRKTDEQLANDSKATYTYDSVGRLTRLSNFTSANTMISSFDYQYDNVGNRTRVVEASGDRVTWSYDNTNQLTREQRSGSGSGSSSSCPWTRRITQLLNPNRYAR